MVITLLHAIWIADLWWGYESQIPSRTPSVSLFDSLAKAVLGRVEAQPMNVGRGWFSNVQGLCGWPEGSQPNRRFVAWAEGTAVYESRPRPHSI